MATTTGNRASLRDLEGADEFTHRHIGPDADDTERMLDVVGAASLDALIAETVPDSIRLEAPLALPGAVTERETLRRLADIASRNTVMQSLIGQGYHGTITPPVVLRNILENPAWYTSYTPYQPEISLLLRMTLMV